MDVAPNDLDDTFEYNPTDQEAANDGEDHLFENNEQNQKLQNRINLGNANEMEEQKELEEGNMDDYEI